MFSLVPPSVRSCLSYLVRDTLQITSGCRPHLKTKWGFQHDFLAHILSPVLSPPLDLAALQTLYVTFPRPPADFGLRVFYCVAHLTMLQCSQDGDRLAEKASFFIRRVLLRRPADRDLDRAVR